VTTEVEISTGGNPLELLDPKREGKHDIHTGAGIVGQ
jgi:hypothetical protein